VKESAKAKLKDKLKVSGKLQAVSRRPSEAQAAGIPAGDIGSPGLGQDEEKVGGKKPKKAVNILIAMLKARKKK